MKLDKIFEEISKVNDYAFQEGYELGYEDGRLTGKRDCLDETITVAEVTYAIAQAIAEYALEAYDEHAINTQQFMAVGEVALALDELAKDLKGSRADVAQ